jgi:hypothetical protein
MKGMHPPWVGFYAWALSLSTPLFACGVSCSVSLLCSTTFSLYIDIDTFLFLYFQRVSSSESGTRGCHQKSLCVAMFDAIILHH